MALNRLINIEVNNDAAQKKLNQMLGTLKKLDGVTAGGAGSSSGTSAVRSQSKALEDYAGKMSNVQRQVAQTSGVISKQERELLKYDTSIRKSIQSLDKGKFSQSEYTEAVDEATARYERRIRAIADGEKTQKRQRTTLLDVTGALENEQRILQQSTGNLSYAEQATLRYDTAVRKLNKAAQDGKLSQAGLNTALKAADVQYQKSYKGATQLDQALSKGRSSFRAMRGATSQLSYQLQDIAVQFQMGTNAATIFTQQFPQIASVFGPAGAIVGVIGAIAGAIAGPLIASMLGAEDATDKLDKSIDGFSATLKTSAGGIFEFTEEIRKLKAASDDAGQLQIALALYDAQQAVEQAGKAIGSGIDGIFKSFFDLSDFDFEDLTENMKKLEDRGFSLGQVLSQDFEFSGRGFLVARRSTEALRDILGDLQEDIGLSKDQAVLFAESINNISATSSASDFTNLIATINSIRKELDGTGTREQRQQFAEVSRILLEIGLKGESAATAVEALGQSTSKLKGSYVPLFSINAELERSILLTGQYGTETTNVLSSIQAEYSRLERIRKEQDESGVFNATDAQLQEQSQKNITKIIADRLSDLDSHALREKELNSIREAGIDLTKEQEKAALDGAQKQNFVYKKQISFLSSVLDVLKQSTDETIKAANETEAWSKLAGQVGEIYNEGAKDYAESVGSYNESLQGLVTSAFKTMENSLVEFAVSGKGSFKDFANSVLEDLLRIQVQQSLVGFGDLISFGGESGAATGATANAKGNAWDSSGAINRYAKGGVTGMVNTIQSTPKRFAGGAGLLGEAGSEAIMPLTRTSGGDLGIKASTDANSKGASPVYVNITNQQGVEGQVTGQTQNADGSVSVDIVAKMVNSTISSGRADAAMKNRFNLKRAGV